MSARLSRWLGPVLFVGSFLIATALFAQDPSPSPAGATADENAIALSAFLPHGGWVVLPIVFCLVVTLIWIATGVARTSLIRIGPRGHEETLRALFRQKDFAGADAFCQANTSSLTKIVRAGVAREESGQQAVQDALETALATEQLRLHTRFSYLKALAICTPLLGLLGTLAGIIRALVTHTVGSPTLAPALGAALVPSAIGLLAGIVAIVAVYLLRERASAAMLRLQDAINSIFHEHE